MVKWSYWIMVSVMFVPDSHVIGSDTKTLIVDTQGWNQFMQQDMYGSLVYHISCPSCLSFLFLPSSLPLSPYISASSLLQLWTSVLLPLMSHWWNSSSNWPSDFLRRVLPSGMFKWSSPLSPTLHKVCLAAIVPPLVNWVMSCQTPPYIISIMRKKTKTNCYHGDCLPKQPY